MHFRQFYLGCLAHASYLIGSEGEAAVVDPQRDIEIYLEEAAIHGFRIRHIIETHMHADFVSGHIELARQTGATIYASSAAQAEFPHHAVKDGEELGMGRVRFRFLDTPGHSPDGLCILVFDQDQGREPTAVLTGDTLFVGDVGRPDLLDGVVSPQELAGRLYDSIHEKLLPLPDHVKVYPAHGAGSLCGRNIGSESSSTIGQERLTNYALQPMSRDKFIALITADQPAAPAYFSKDQQLNRRGAVSLSDLPPIPSLTPDQVAESLKRGHTLLDVRPCAEFGDGHVPGSINIGLQGQFAAWAGAVVGLETPLVLVASDEAQVSEARLRLARVGIENVVGFLAGGVGAWADSGRDLTRLEQLRVEDLHARLTGDPESLQIIDVRRQPEWDAGRVATAQHITLMELRRRVHELDSTQPYAVVCAGGYRSSIACSILLNHGFKNLRNVTGGMGAWKQAELPWIS